MKKNKYVFLTTVMCFTAILLYGQPKAAMPGHISLPGFFSNNMLLQSNKPIELRGMASPEKKFEIAFAGKKIVRAAIVGQWAMVYPPMKAGRGYELNIISDGSFLYKNILLGDVWIASGGNMEFTFGNTESVAIDMAENENIRVYTTPTAISDYPLHNCIGLMAKNNAALKGFAIAGGDRKFVWAKATIGAKDKIIVSSPSAAQPQSVHYAWASSPVEANLISTAGVPAAPF